jgi:hypothetical protein
VPPSPAPTHTAAVEALPADEPIRKPIPLPRRRPGVFATAATAATAATTAPAATAGGRVPVPRARPVDAPAQAATSSVNDTLYGYRPGLDSDR